MAKRVALKTFGCRANQYDSAVISYYLNQGECEVVDFDDYADIYIINSCAITHNADNEAKQFIRRARKTNPNAMAIVTGCSAEVNPEVFSKQEGVQYVLGTNQKAQISEIIKNYQDPESSDSISVADHDFSDIFFSGGVNLPNHSRSFLKIQDGCSQFCSFCIVPYARGLNRSIPVDQVIESLYQLRDKNIEEVVLTGIHLGTYGKDLKPKTNFYELLKRIHELKPIKRLRLSSIDPEELSDEMIELISSDEFFCNHLHLPLQSGDNQVLKRMKRRYTREYFIDLCLKVHQQWQNVCIGTDVIVGFPGEDDSAFLNTLDTIKKARLSYVHTFPYSPRRGTKAYDFEDQVDPKIKKMRSKIIRDESLKLKNQFSKNQLGKDFSAIIEKRGNGYKALTSNYLSVEITNPNHLNYGELKRIKINQINNQQELIGSVLN